MSTKTKANKLARGIFQAGEDRGPVQRIEFKGGSYPVNEFSLGGLNEKALSSVIYRLLVQLEEIEE